jgi:hypothetical protein
MAQDEKAWSELNRRLIAFVEAEDALKEAVARLHLRPGANSKDSLPKNKIEPTPYDEEKWEVVPHGIAESGMDVLRMGAKGYREYRHWWETAPLSAKYTITEPPDLTEHQRIFLCAFTWTKRSYWRVLAWLSTEAVVLIPPNLGLSQPKPALRRALDGIRGWTPTYMDYGLPKNLDDATEAYGDPREIPSTGEDPDDWPPERYECELPSAFYRVFQLGGLVLNRPLPEHVLRTLKECRKTYQLGCAMAAIALCRSVIEAVTRYWLVEHGFVQPGQARSEDGTRRLEWSDYSTRLLTHRHDLRKMLIFPDGPVEIVRGYANDILHPKLEEDASDAEALVALRYTFHFAEALLAE